MNDPHDRECHDEALFALYRQTRGAEPPAWLDQRILTAARAAVESSPAPVVTLPKRRGARFWAVPVALAATVVLAVGIVRLARETGEPGTRLETKAVPSLGQSAASQDATPAREIAPVTVGGTPPEPESPHTASLPAPAAPLPSAPASGPFSPASQPVPAMPPEAGRLRAMPAEGDKRDLLEAPVKSEKEGTIRYQKVDRSPEEWLARIAELRREGRTAEAEASLREFRRHYPDYPLRDK